VVAIKASEAPPEALSVAKRTGVHYLIVMDDDSELVGVVCRCDLRRAKVDDAVGGVTHAPPVLVSVHATAEDALTSMQQCGVGCLPVLDDEGRIIGVLTRHDLRVRGLLGDELGVDRCASCGTSHGLICSDGLGVVFCEECMERTPPVGTVAREMYCTIGGGD
jgi:acetoin utilization protein AcuB